MISVYLAGDSWAHRLPAGLKLLAVALGSLLLFRMTNGWAFAIALCIVFVCYASLGREGWARLKLLRGLSVVLVVLMALHWLSGTFWEGALIMMRLTVMVLAANFVSITTRLDDMLDAVMPLFKPLEWVGLSPRVPALGVTLVLRFAPLLVQVFFMLQEAYQARTGKKTSWRLIAPFALQSLRMSENVAEALSARGGAAGLGKEQ